MTKTLYIPFILLSMSFLACKTDTKTNETESAFTISTKAITNEPSISLTIADGPLKGTYHFEKIKGKPRGSITVSYFDETTKNVSQRNTSSLSALGFSLPDDNFILNNVVKLFKGDITIGKLAANRDTKKENEDCGSFMLVDRENKHSWNKVIGVNMSCNPVTIQTISMWKKKTVGYKRFVSGSYNDTYELEFRQDNGGESTFMKTEISVTFNAIQQKYD